MTTTTSPADHLEARLAGFGKLGLLKLAAALVTNDRCSALTVGLAMDALPIDVDLTDELVADALEALGELAHDLANDLDDGPQR